MTLDHELQALSDTIKTTFSPLVTLPGPTACLGKGDGLGTLLVPNGQPGEIYLHNPVTNQQYHAYLDPTKPLVLLQDGHPEIESQWVDTGYERGSTILKVLGPNDQAGRQAAGTLTQMQSYWNEAWWAQLKQITYCRPRPTDTPSTSIQIDIGALLLDPATGLLHSYTSLYLTLGTYIDALTAGQHQLLMPYVNRATHAAGVLALAAVASTAAVGTTASHNEFTGTTAEAFTGITSDMQLTVALEIWYGQTEITEAAFYRTSLDARFQIGSGAGGSVDKIVTDENGNVVSDENGTVVTCE